MLAQGPAGEDSSQIERLPLGKRFWAEKSPAEVARGVAEGALSAGEGEKIRRFAAEGFLTVPLPRVDEALVGEVVADVDRFWREKPVDLAYIFLGRPRSMGDSNRRRERMAPYRILDPHSHSEALRQVYLDPDLFAWARRIMGEEPVAFHSRFCEFGRSEQPIRDGLNVDVERPGFLLSAWVALEDIGEENGPLFVVPGSHRLPFYRFDGGRMVPRDDEEAREAHRFHLGAVRDGGLEPRVLELRRGECVFLHPALLYGARRILRPDATRRSLQVYLASRAELTVRTASFLKWVRGSWWRREKRLFWQATSEQLERGEASGFQNPLRGLRPSGMSLGAKIRSRLGI